MSVLADLRNLSSKEYYKNALRIRKELELYLTRDFAKKALKHNISTVAKQINDADKVILNEISSKYMPDDFRIFKIDTPKDYADAERKYLINLCREMTSNIVSADSIYVGPNMHKSDLIMRRNYQNKALAACYKLLEELYEMQEMYPTELNDMNKLLSLLDNEYNLITGWRRSDNKFLGKA